MTCPPPDRDHRDSKRQKPGSASTRKHETKKWGRGIKSEREEVTFTRPSMNSCRPPSGVQGLLMQVRMAKQPRSSNRAAGVGFFLRG